ncbi:h domain protein [Nocardia huaxiensis]|uniref:H domain protein n=1 Tax=Nocardia huaxiensis TaxID=2755382 RepID=A0A7D6ZQX2_9NOCA|nr:h domain protein [Nocardia huaxiensis]QLY31545.1 h domain protein [Nocardia huaxiensis]UFS95096.1 h domain protein [Nocardia huaxiensis]
MKTDKRSLLIAAAGVLFVAAVAVASLTAWTFWSDRQAEQNRASSAEAAQRTVEALFSYDFNNVDNQLATAAENLTSTYRDDYMKVIAQQAIPAAKETKLTVRTTAQASGVISTSRDSATILVFANQLFMRGDSDQKTITGSRLQVELTKQDGQWLVSNIIPV